MTNTYVIGDIAGNYDTLMRLISKFQPPYTIVSVGDIIDRGPKSKEVIRFFMSHPDDVVLMGNHEHMFCYEREDSLHNGGKATLESFGGEPPDDVMEWLRNLPWKHQIGNVVITHAPIPNPKLRRWREEPVELWNRYDPAPIEGIDLQVFGHNAHLERFGDYAICIDDSHGQPKQLCALHLESKTVLSEIVTEC